MTTSKSFLLDQLIELNGGKCGGRLHRNNFVTRSLLLHRNSTRLIRYCMGHQRIFRRRHFRKCAHCVIPICRPVYVRMCVSLSHSVIERASEKTIEKTNNHVMKENQIAYLNLRRAIHHFFIQCEENNKICSNFILIIAIFTSLSYFFRSINVILLNV